MLRVAVAVFVAAMTAGCPEVTGPEACCECLAENVCILGTDEQVCVDDLTAGENPDRNERPFGEGIALNEDCVDESCGGCIAAVLADTP